MAPLVYCASFQKFGRATIFKVLKVTKNMITSDDFNELGAICTKNLCSSCFISYHRLIKIKGIT